MNLPMGPLTRQLRPRQRRLPLPPSSNLDQPRTVQNSEKPLGTIYNQPLTQPEPIFEKTIKSPISEEQLAAKMEETLKGRKSVLNELGDVFKSGVSQNLTKTKFESSPKNIDYFKIKQIQYKRAVDDYIAAGKTLGDSGLYSNATIAFTCAVLAKLLATTSIQESYQTFQEIIEKTQDKQIIRSSLFSLLTHLFEALAKKDRMIVKDQIIRLKRIETFSSDDQELINEAVKFLLKHYT